MDEVTAEIIKAGAEAALAPVTKVVSDVIGYTGADWIEHKRKRHLHKLEENTRRICEERGCKPDDANPAIALPIIAAAQDEDREELRDV